MPDKQKQGRIFPRWINLKLLFLLLMGMVIAHLVIFVIYSQRNSSVEFRVNRDILSRQIINFIQTMHNTPIDEQEQLVKALGIANFKISIEEQPKFDDQFINASLWQVLKEISTQSPNIQLSYLLSANRWLNISAPIIQKSVGMQTLLLSLEIITILAVIICLWTINRFTVPLRKVTEAAERLGVDLHTKPLDIYGPRVARTTAHAINKMQERIRDLIQGRTQMLAAISHDLRTPITRLKLRTQYVDDDVLYQKMVKDLDEMESMIAETLSFAREDNKNETRVKLDLASLLSSLCDNFAETGHDVIYQGEPTGIPVRAAMVALRRVFTNLIDNAVKYGNKAIVNCYREDGDVVITIADEGPGIAEAYRDKVFQPFFRGEHSRSRSTGGTGLGLAVAQDIIHAHGGSITLQSVEPHGLQVIVRLPDSR